MKKDTLIGLAVTNPHTLTRAICVGFKSKEQAYAFGQLRSKLKQTVTRPLVVVMPDIDKYEMVVEHTQQDLKNELSLYFHING
jgi:hypothetical protein